MADRKNVVIYIGNFAFPQDNAAGKRVYANCCILRDMGYRVICIGTNLSGSNRMSMDDKKVYDGIEYYSFCYSNGKNRLKYWRYYKDIQLLIKECGIQNQIRAIFVYANLSIAYLNIKILKWAKSKNIMCYSDCADWFNPPKGNLLLKVWKKLDTDLQMRTFNRSVDGIVCISSYLAQYYKVQKTVIIPPLTNIKQIGKIIREDTIASFVYAGSKFRSGEPVDPIYWKDRLDIMIRCFYQASILDPSVNFKFTIIGITKNEFFEHLPIPMRKSYTNMVNSLNDKLVFIDYLPHELVEQKISKADFSILIRDKKRMTMVGFPTKVSEAVSCGTPVLCNDTSDIKHFINNDKFGIVSEVEDIPAQIVKIAHMDNSELMRLKAECLYENPFHYTNFKEELQKFLGEES